MSGPGRRFVLAYALAYVGLYAGFVPLFTILLPLKAASVAGDGRLALLSAAATIGAVVASVANIGWGLAGDRLHARRGTRAPLVAAGIPALAAGYLAFHLAATPAGVIGAIALVQVALNMMFASLAAVMADRVPDARKGSVAGLIGTAHPLGLLAATVVTWATEDQATRLALALAGMTAAMLPFLLAAPGNEAGTVPPPVAGRRGRDFALATLSRMLTQVAGSALLTFALFYFQSVGRGDAEAAARPTALILAFASLLGTAAALIAGVASDRAGRRKPLLAGAACAMAAGLAVMAAADGWAMAILGYATATAGLSAFLALNAALATEALPSPHCRGRDLGFLNLANTAPSMLAPMLALGLGGSGSGLAPFLLLLAGLALAAGAAVLPIRTVR